MDTTPIGKKFGDVSVDAAASYQIGETAEVVFIGANPRNDLMTAQTFLSVRTCDFFESRAFFTKYDLGGTIQPRHSELDYYPHRC